MDKMIVVGNENYDEFIKEDGYYVDKTELVHELVAKTRNKVTLFTRPRRFGKSLTMSMLESFFDIRRDSADVFRGRKIMENHPDFCKEWMNRYPVLFLSLKDVEGLDFESACAMLGNRISGKCAELAYLAEDVRITERDRKAFERLQSEQGSISDIKSSLDTMMRMMKAVYGKPVILLIDEYDVAESDPP